MQLGLRAPLADIWLFMLGVKPALRAPLIWLFMVGVLGIVPGVQTALGTEEESKQELVVVGPDVRAENGAGAPERHGLASMA